MGHMLSVAIADFMCPVKIQISSNKKKNLSPLK